MSASLAVPPGRFPHALVAAALLCACGCVEREVAWLPDSSGFVYTDKGGARLVHYDLGKKARRVISEDAKLRCGGPAVSPDGKYFAVAQCESTFTAGSRAVARKLVVAVFDRDGREQSRSRPLEVEESLEEPAKESDADVSWSMVCWEGHPDRLLTPFGVYDRKADRWVKLPAVPAVFLAPGCPPTAKGFLAAYVQAPGKAAAAGRKVCFVDWDGWASDFKEPVKNLDRSEMVAGRWDGRTWRLVATGGVYSFDTAGLKHEFTTEPDKVWDFLGRPAAYHRFPGTDLALAAFEKVYANFRSTHRLELRSTEKQRRKVIYGEGEYTSLKLYPSPNGKLVAVRCSHPGVEGDYVVDANGGVKFVPRVPPLPPKNVIVVFDDAGEVVATAKPE